MTTTDSDAETTDVETVDGKDSTGFRGHYAGGVSRLTAVTIDAVTIVVMFYAGLAIAVLTLALVRLKTPAFPSISGWVWTVAFLGWLFIYAWVSWSVTGKTVGKALLGLRIVSKTGGKIGSVMALRRCFGWIVALTFFGLGFFWILISRDRRGWHDYIAGTCVIYDWDAHVGKLIMSPRDDGEPGEHASP